MEKQSTLTEILLLTGTSFSARQYREKEETPPGQTPTEREQLQAACWNGLLKEMLPEIFVNAVNHLFLWQIREGESFLELELSEYPASKDPCDSIDPYSFFSTIMLN
jgi:hypothetical protein